ncbi:MAG: Uncharacterized protein Athens071425_85 [Parcubacteria group bacterium Athens0714_25]|nr:MAG: Uncharacterized protein Athens071425_85 [Parcubacteria group bacterium Athens0714_25]
MNTEEEIPKKKTHTLLVSDFHLGSKVSRSQEAAQLLKSIEFERLILLGDIFENLNFNHLRKQDWEFLSLISKISESKKVVWIEGNHDSGLTQIFTVLTGVKVHKTYHWKHKGKKYFAIHGHQFDNFLVDNAVISIVANQIYNFIQIIDFQDRRVSRYIKEKSKGWLRLSEKVATRALLYAKLIRADYIFCGHTHKAMQREDGDIKYYNCGCWTDIPAAFVTIDEDDIKINYWN